MTKFNQKGSTHIVAVVGVLVIAVAGFVGYRVLNANQTESAGSAKPVATQSTVPKKISTKADVIKASKALDETAIDGSVNPNQLDQDLNSL